MASSTWLKDLALSANLLDHEAWPFIRLLILSDYRMRTQEQRANLLRALDNLEENKTSKDDFLELMVRELGYLEAGWLVRDLYHMMEMRRRVMEIMRRRRRLEENRRIPSRAESDGVPKQLPERWK